VAQAINIRLEDFEGMKVKVPAHVPQETGRILPHEVLKEAREEYNKQKKVRAVKAITYVMVERPQLVQDRVRRVS
jgi:uncharacterized protein YccT (UPF0319 family)